MIFNIAAASLIVQNYQVNESTVTEAEFALATTEGIITLMIMLIPFMFDDNIWFQPYYIISRSSLIIQLSTIRIIFGMFSLIYSAYVMLSFSNKTVIIIDKGLYNMSVAVIVLDSISILVLFFKLTHNIRLRAIYDTEIEDEYFML